MKDLCGVELDKFDFITSKIRAVGMKYGYSMIYTPLLEFTEVFKRSIGDETDIVSKEMYTFSDRGGESVTLRPEGTAGVVRAIVTENMTQRLPVKLMYCGEMFRYDRPQKGRFRQFRQFGFEHIGDKNPYTDGIMIVMAVEAMHAAGIHDFKVVVNSLGDVASRAKYTKALVEYLSIHKASLSADSQERLLKNPLRILDSKSEADAAICAGAPRLSEFLNEEASAYFAKLREILDTCGVAYEVNEFLVRGLDYYCHTTFEFKSTADGYGDSLGGGGRYDTLLQTLGGPDVSGIGLAFGMERLMMMFDERNLPKKHWKVGVVPISEAETDAALALFTELLANDVCAEFVHLGTPSKKMKVADRLDCDIVCLLGSEEIADGVVTVKFMKETNNDAKTESVNLREIVKFLHKKMGQNKVP